MFRMFPVCCSWITIFKIPKTLTLLLTDNFEIICELFWLALKYWNYLTRHSFYDTLSRGISKFFWVRGGKIYPTIKISSHLFCSRPNLFPFSRFIRSFWWMIDENGWAKGFIFLFGSVSCIKSIKKVLTYRINFWGLPS